MPVIVPPWFLSFHPPIGFSTTLCRASEIAFGVEATTVFGSRGLCRADAVLRQVHQVDQGHVADPPDAISRMTIEIAYLIRLDEKITDIFGRIQSRAPAAKQGLDWAFTCVRNWSRGRAAGYMSRAQRARDRFSALAFHCKNQSNEHW